MSTRIAILGTGRMGSTLARRLTDFDPILWNRTRDSRGAGWGGTRSRHSR